MLSTAATAQKKIEIKDGALEPVIQEVVELTASENYTKALEPEGVEREIKMGSIPLFIIT